MRRLACLAAALAALPLAALAAGPPARPGVDAPSLAALGPHAVGVAEQTWTDPARGGRSLRVLIWYPAAAAGTPVVYRSALSGEDGRPVPFTAQGLAARESAPAVGRFPLVVLAHGFGNTPEALAWLGENLATKGYVVVAPDFADPPYSDRPRLAQTIGLRPGDVAFVARQARVRAGEGPLAGADPDHLGLIGYSLGGYGVLAAAGAARSPSEVVPGVRAVAAISPAGGSSPLTLFAPASLAAIHAPTFFIAGSADHVVGYDPGVRTLFAAEAGARRWLLTFEEAGHNIALAATPEGAPEEMREHLWDQDWFEDPVWRKSRLTAVEAHFLTAFLDRQLKGDTAKDTYLEGLVPDSGSGSWNGSHAYAAVSPGPPAATLWTGFQTGHAVGMRLEVLPASR